MKYYILAGEASGDLHGSTLVRALKKKDPAAVIRAWGGDLMAEAGAEVVKHYRDLAFMGFVEVVKNLPAILRNFRECKADILRYRPDALILIDYPGFNLRMANWAKKQGLRVYYYISPQLWAWKTGRVKIIRRTVARMYVILPFEKTFYQKHGVAVEFVGHPLLDAIGQYDIATDFFKKNSLDEQTPIIALLPGSRRQEVARMLPLMAAVASRLPKCQFVVAGAPAIERTYYETLLPPGSPVKIVENQTYPLLRHAYAALVTSGTATLETALFDVPQVVCYKGGSISFWLAKRLVNKDLKFIALVNLIAGHAIVKELIQEDFNLDNLEKELKALLAEKSRAPILRHYADLRSMLGFPGASDRVANSIVNDMRQSM